MAKTYTEQEVNEIVRNALDEQLAEIERENRLVAIEEAIGDLQGRVTELEKNSKSIGFGGKN